MVGPTGIEPVCIAARDFKSLVSTYFTTVPYAVLLLCVVVLLYAASVYGQPGGIRTPDPQLRRLLLYPTELRADTWWAPRESNSAPTDYESAALTNMS